MRTCRDIDWGVGNVFDFNEFVDVIGRAIAVGIVIDRSIRIDQYFVDYYSIAQSISHV
jgi:hypothetical protein